MLPGHRLWAHLPHSDTFACHCWNGVAVDCSSHSVPADLLASRASENATNVCHVLHSRHNHMHYSLLQWDNKHKHMMELVKWVQNGPLSNARSRRTYKDVREDNRKKRRNLSAYRVIDGGTLNNSSLRAKETYTNWVRSERNAFLFPGITIFAPPKTEIQS